VVAQFLVLLGAGIGTAFLLDTWSHHDFPILTALAVFGSFISYIYSAPPLKLKQNGWAGNYALGASYIALPWWAGQVGGAAARRRGGRLALLVAPLPPLWAAAWGRARVRSARRCAGPCTARHPAPTAPRRPAPPPRRRLCSAR
jgi:4-hydroxybenzoate polyprenyltransferase